MLFPTPAMPFVATPYFTSISAICNLPVGPFMGAAKEGWGRYFRGLHRATGEKGLLDRNNAHEGLPRSTRRSRSPLGRQQRPPPERRTRLGQTQGPQSNFRSHQGSSNSATNARRASNNTRRRREDFDGLAESRARAAKRAEAEDVTRRMTLRLHTLWQELKVPEPDRAYVLAAYVGGDWDQAENPGGNLRRKDGGPPTVEMQRELARQISLLLKYRAATIKVREQRRQEPKDTHILLYVARSSSSARPCSCELRDSGEGKGYVCSPTVHCTVGRTRCRRRRVPRRAWAIALTSTSRRVSTTGAPCH